MLRWIIQVFIIGVVVYAGYQNRYRLLNVALSIGVIRRFLISRSLSLPIVRDQMMQSVFSNGKME